jgi:hypothetical protein
VIEAPGALSLHGGITCTVEVYGYGEIAKGIDGIV